jgi:hypothetical protein
MEKEKNRDTDVEHAVFHQIPLGIFAIMRDENGKEKEVDIRDIVGSKGEEENK